MKIKVIAPVATDRWNEPARKEYSLLKEPETEISFVNIQRGPESIECRYDVAWAELPTLLEAEKAEKEGYDGIILYCFGDPGLGMIKEAVSIPVVGICEASIHIGSMLGTRFSVITVGPSSSISQGYIEDNIRKYGLINKCASIRVAKIRVLELLNDPKREADLVFVEAREAVEHDEAQVIVLGCGGMLGLKDRIETDLKVPVVVPGNAALKVCETLVKMRVSQSKKCFALPPQTRRDY